MDLESVRARLGGVAAVPICPFRANDESIDELAFRNQITFLLESGVDSIVPCGNTMEFYSMTTEEAKAVVTATTDVVQQQVPVIVGIGHDTATAIALAHHAETAGADAVMVHQPVHPFLSGQGVVEYIKTIAGATELGIILYVRRELLDVNAYLELFELPNLIGVKHATNDLQAIAELVQATRGSAVAWICGSAEGWAPFYRLAGARGFTSGLANVFPRFTLSMRDALHRSDFETAMEVWRTILPFEQMRAKDNNAFNVSVIKEAMNQLGRNGGIVRKPASPLTIGDRKSLSSLLESWGAAVASPRS